jgi:hypothetical protein
MEIGPICCAKAKSTGCDALRAGPNTLPSKVTVILRSSVEMAKRTVDETAIYAGEVVFPDVLVTQAAY